MLSPTVSLAHATTVKLSEGLKAGEGLEMRKVSYKFPARWGTGWIRREGGELGLLILCQWGGRHPCSKAH